MDKIFYKEKLLGIKIKKRKLGTSPITDTESFLQVLTLNYKKGHVVIPHDHKPKKRITTELNECIVIVKGKVRVKLYGGERKPVKQVILSTGDTFLYMRGGHSVHFLDDAELIEIKNGPFIDDRFPL